MRILVIDDEQDIRDATQVLLEHFGHEVRTAKNGVAGVECVSEWLPHAVITDLAMPEMDGFLVTRKLRRLCAGEKLLIVACSAHLQDRPTRDLARAAGADECLVKPVAWNRLRAILQAFEQTLSLTPELG